VRLPVCIWACVLVEQRVHFAGFSCVRVSQADFLEQALFIDFPDGADAGTIVIDVNPPNVVDAWSVALTFLLVVCGMWGYVDVTLGQAVLGRN
jgi:hypothetical protein